MFPKGENAEMQHIDNAMLRRSTRLMESGCYDRNDPTNWQISYKETPGRIFNKRKPSKRKRGSKGSQTSSINDFNMCDFQSLETNGPILISETSKPTSSSSRCLSVMRKIFLISAFLTLLGFGVWFSYTFADSYRREMDSLKQTVILQKTEYEKSIELMKWIIEQTLEREKVEEIVHLALIRQRADDIGMADYALESLGATVIDSSETYITRYWTIFGFRMPCPINGPEKVIQPDVNAGKCWPFKGSQGHVVISLPYPTLITHVTLEHLPKALSLTNDYRSAPRDFAVYGMNKMNEEGKLLGKFKYDQDVDSIRTFELLDPPALMYQFVQLRILSNWGHPEYTCVYRFRIHSLAGTKKNVSISV